MASSCKKGYYFCNSSQKCKRIPRGHKVQSDGELVREYVSDWRSDLQELAPSQQGLSTLADRKKIQKGFDNLPQFMPKTTTTTKNGKTSTSSTMVSREAETKRQLDKVGPVAGVKVKMDSDGNVPDGGAFAKAQMSKALNNVKPNSKFSASNIETAKRFNQNNTERMVNSATPGTWQFRADIATDEINQATQGARTKANKNKGRIRNVVTNNEELQGGVSVEPYTKDTKFLEVETVDIIKPKALNASNWRSDLEIVNEGWKFVDPNKGRNDYGLPKGLKGGGIKDAGSDPVDVMKKMILGDRAKKTVDPKKNEVISASYEAALNDLVVEVLKYDIEDLHNSGFSYEEIAEYYDVKDEVLSEAPAPLVSAGVKILQKVAPKVTKFIANRAVKDSKKVVNWARKPGNWKALNKNIDKVTLPVGKALKELPARTYAAGKNFRKAVDATYNAGKALRGATTNALSSAKKNLLPAAKGGLKNVTDAGTRFSNFVDKAYSALEKGTKKLGQRIGDKARQDTAIRNLDKAKINKTKEIFAKVKKLEKKGDVAGDVIDVTKTTKYKKPGDPWNWFPKKSQPQKGIPKPSVDRTNKSLNPAGGALSAIKDKGSALVAKVRNFFSKKGTKQLTGTKTPNQLSGTNVKGSLPSGSSKGTKQPYSSKRELAKDWMAYQKSAQKTLNKEKGINTAKVVGSGLVGGALGYKTGQEIGKWSDSKAKGYVVDMPGYDPSDKQSPETIKKINDLTYKQMQKDKEKGPSQGDSSTINGKKVSITHSSVYGKETPKKETPKTTKPKGKTKWVGVNSTWTDRHGNVIAPRMKKTTKPKKGILTPLEQELED